MIISKLIATVALMAAIGSTQATTILDFESPGSVGLVPMTFWQDTPVPASAIVTNQYLDQGVLISNAALIDLGYGHAASGTMGLGGINQNGLLDYDAPVTFSFFLFGNVKATTDYFAYSPDLGGWSGNTITLTAYATNGDIVGQTSYVETGVFSSPLFIQGIGSFHSVTIDQTLINHWSGGIGIDLVTYGDLTPASAVPAPSAFILILTALGLLGLFRRKQQAH